MGRRRRLGASGTRARADASGGDLLPAEDELRLAGQETIQVGEAPDITPATALIRKTNAEVDALGAAYRDGGRGRRMGDERALSAQLGAAVIVQ